MQPTDLTIEALQGIRDEARKTNARLDGIAARLDKTNDRLEGTNDRLEGTNERVDGINERLDRIERRQTETEVRLVTEIVAVAGAVHEVRDLLREDRALRSKVDDHERRITAIEARSS
jgi:archaellum component FlaC